MTDRDTFAAAALTGLLSRSIAPEQAMSQYVRIAAAYADAMLRERERHHIPDSGKMVETSTNHDAAPAARAQNPTTGSCPAREGCCTGNAKVGVPDTGSGAGSTPVAQQPSRGIRAGLCQPFDSAPTTLDAQPGAKAEPSERGTRREGQGTGNICERLRAEIAWEQEVGELMHEAATEIERLRIRRHERDAIVAAAESVKLDDDSNWTTLIELLERTK